ncbi:MAG: anti-sigma factor [Anaerolineae bacterium]
MDESRASSEEEFQDRVAAYCLGALSPEEMAKFESELETSPEMREAVASYDHAVTALGLAPAIQTPPPALRERLLAQIGDAPPVPQRQDLRVLPSSQHRFSQYLPWLAAAAMFLLAVVAGARAWTLQSDVTDLETALSTTRTVPMENSSGAPRAQGRFYLAPDSHRGVLVVADMPPLSPDRDYQLWLIRPDGVRESGGTFRVDSGGYGTLLVQAPQPMHQYTGVGVTSEPTGGSPSPTTPRLIGGSFQQVRDEY